MLGVLVRVPLAGILSGFAVPTENMPQAVGWFSGLDPVRHMLVLAHLSTQSGDKAWNTAGWAVPA